MRSSSTCKLGLVFLAGFRVAPALPPCYFVVTSVLWWGSNAGRIISKSNFQMAPIIAICKLLIWRKIEAINIEEIKSLVRAGRVLWQIGRSVPCSRAEVRGGKDELVRLVAGHGVGRLWCAPSPAQWGNRGAGSNRGCLKKPEQLSLGLTKGNSRVTG